MLALRWNAIYCTPAAVDPQAKAISVMAVDRSSQRPKRWAAVDGTEGIAAHRPPAIPSFPQRRLSPKCQLTERPLPKHTFRSGLTVSAIPPKMGRAARNRTIRHSISNHAVAPLSLTRAYGVRPCKLNSPASWFQWQPSHSPMQLFHALSVFHDWPFPGNDFAAATAQLHNVVSTPGSCSRGS